MDKINMIISACLVVIIISLSIYMAVKSNIYNKMINDLKAENKSLIKQISSAESYIDMQNLKISEYGSSMKKAEESYKKQFTLINEKYSDLKMKYEDSKRLKCDEILSIINNNQRRFIYNE